jgi:putative ABC transport system substrate-binding protein
MISRRAVIAGIAAIVMACRADAQSPAKVYRLGVLVVGRRPTIEALARSPIVSKLRELGWEEGRNLSIDYRYTESPDALPQLSAGLIASQPDVLIALGPFPAHALKDATQTIPIVFGGVADPVGRGLVPSLARPGGNVTGVSHYVGPGMEGKPVELLKELVPRAQRIASLINPANPIYRTGVFERVSERVSRELKVSVQRIEARSAAELPAAFEAAVRARADGLVVTAEALFYSERDTIVKLAAKHKLPATYPRREFVEAGGLISYGANFAEIYRRVAVYVDKILRGAKPADLPIEQPTTFELVVNLKTAKALGLTVPPPVLLRADEIIE